VEIGATILREVRIVDAGVVTAAGNSLDGTWQKIISGTTAIREIDRFRVDAYRSRFGAAVPGIEPGGPASMTDSVIGRLIGHMGRIPRDSLVISASTNGGIDNLEKMKRGLPFEPADISPFSIGDKVMAKMGLTGGTVNVCAACASSTIAVIEGAAMIASGRADSVLICCVDVLTEFVFSGFSALQVLSPVPCKPFDKDRAGLSPGEGGAFILLMSSECARRDGYSFGCVVAGSGIANDAFHITKPHIHGQGLMQAAARAVRKAGIKMADIAGISAHGTGTTHNDLMELTSFRAMFGDKCPPLYSVKGCVGHTFGAAGGIDIAVATRALADQVIPPTAGFQNPEKGAEGVVGRAPTAIAGDYLLVTNSGFGGINASVILKRSELQ
jgi:3-oxoacyl-[acyl-carrier-protein] synthase II